MHWDRTSVTLRGQKIKDLIYSVDSPLPPVLNEYSLCKLYLYMALITWINHRPKSTSHSQWDELYSGQLALSAQLIILNYPVIVFHRRSTTVSLETYPLSPIWVCHATVFQCRCVTFQTRDANEHFSIPGSLKPDLDISSSFFIIAGLPRSTSTKEE